jgi:zinc protease
MGVAGGVSEAFVAKARADLAAALPWARRRAGASRRPSRRRAGRDHRAEATAAAAISFGYPLEVVAGHPDFVPLHLCAASSASTAARSPGSTSACASIRGMNYGDYAYTSTIRRDVLDLAAARRARSQQAFRVWIRPVPLEQTHFAIRIAKYELDKLVAQGMTQSGLRGRPRLPQQVHRLLTAQQGTRLGYTSTSSSTA